MLSAPPPRAFRIPLGNGSGDFVKLHEALAAFLAGESAELLEVLAEAMPSGPPWHRALHEEALTTLTEFYELGPRRTRSLREQYDAASALVLQERLDDLVVIAGRS